MNELKIINEQEVLGKDFKIYGDVENPLFLAKDVANWIEHNKPTELLSNIDNEEKLKAIVSHSGQNREMWFLTEDGLYEVLMQSRKPIAKEFKKEVKIILKTIRKTGGFVNNTDLMINTYFSACDPTTKSLVGGLLTNIEQQQLKIISQQKEIEYKENVIIGLVEDIDLTTKRQRINQIIRKGSNNNPNLLANRWSLLYQEFGKKYHVNLKLRLINHKDSYKPKLKNNLDLIDREMNIIPQLYEITCKLFENDVKILMKEWENAI